jgi:ribosomal-protein-alanine N-acetyltransferase
MSLVNFTSFPVLNTERLTLRQLSNNDIEALYKIRSDETVNRYIDRPKETTVDKVKAFILKINEDIKQNKCLYWAICLKDNPNLIGTACLWNFTDDMTAEIGYELSPGFHGQGLMNEVLECILDYSFNVLGLKKLEAFTHKDNIKSIRLLEKNKFMHDKERKDEHDLNYLIYSILLSVA